MQDIKESAGSLEPIKTRGKWHEGIDASGLVQLAALARDIDKTIDSTVKSVARGKIRVGKLLIEARQFFSADQEFGKWRKDNTMIQSKQHAHYLMQMAERFGDAPRFIEGVNYSVLQELILAEPEAIEWVKGRVAEGDPPTVAETREKVKKGTSKKITVGNMTKEGFKNKYVQSPHAAINALVQMSLTQRIQQVVKQRIVGIEGDFIIMGMDPDPQCPCHLYTLTAIGRMWSDAAENADERRAVSDSEERVIQEFKNWNK